MAIECWLGSFVIFRDPHQYCQKTLYFCDFSGETQTPCPPPSGSAHGASGSTQSQAKHSTTEPPRS